MTTKERDLVGRLLRQSILTVCRETVPYAQHLEIDGIVCISSEDEAKQIVIKVHELFHKANDNPIAIDTTPFRRSPELAICRDSVNGDIKNVDQNQNCHTGQKRRDEPELSEQSKFMKEEPKQEIEPPINKFLQENTGDQEHDDNRRYILSDIPMYDDSNPELNYDSDLSSEESNPDRLKANETVEGPDTPQIEPTHIRDIECKRCNRVLEDGRAFETHNLSTHNVYTCRVCYNTFTCRNNMKRHMRLHTGYRPYQCTLCSESFTRKDDIKRHLIRHNYSKPFRCSLCHKGYMDRKSIKVHLQKDHNTNLVHCCPTCGEAFDDLLAFQEHKKSHPELLIYQCSLCNFTGANSLMYNKHMLIHGREKSFQCVKCEIDFPDPFKYTTHLKKHRVDPTFTSYKCCFCSHKLETYEQFVKHEHTHVQCKRHTCTVCMKQFRYPSNLREHMLIHSDMSKQIKVTLKKSEEMPQINIAEESPISEADSSGYEHSPNNDIETDMNDFDLQTDKMSSQYWCTECNQGFGSENHLTEHIAMAHDEDDKSIGEDDDKSTIVTRSANGVYDEERISCNRDDVGKTSVTCNGYYNDIKSEQCDENESTGSFMEQTSVTSNRKDSILRNLFSSRLESPRIGFGNSKKEFGIMSGEEIGEIVGELLDAGSSQNRLHQSDELDRSQSPTAIYTQMNNRSVITVPSDVANHKLNRSQTVSPVPITNEINHGSATLLTKNMPVFPENVIVVPSKGSSPTTKNMPSISTTTTRSPGFERVVTPDVLFRSKVPFECDICKGVFADFDEFDKHCNNVHRRFICDFCGKQFTSKPNRDRHVRYHTGEKPYKCELCNLSFFRGDDLKYHRTTRHSDVKPFNCSKCHMTFAWAKDLEKHLKGHK